MDIIQAAFSGISVNDIEAAKQFYVELIGLELLDDQMGLRFKLPGGGELFIYEKSDHQPASFTVLNFVVADIDTAVDELAGKGISLLQYDFGNGVKTDEKGVMRGRAANRGPDIAWFTDPAGNVLSVLQAS